MIDTHCHVDQIDNPELMAAHLEKQKILTIAVTNLPSHFILAKMHLAGLRFVRPALGLHPLLAQNHPQELPLFHNHLKETQYIGEIGLDFSGKNRNLSEKQVESFQSVLSGLKSVRRFISIHSRGAEEVVLDLLEHYSIPSVCFHWYSGSTGTLQKIIRTGHYISINPSMITYKKWEKIIIEIPRGRILTETDCPFSRYEGMPTQPDDIRVVLEWLGHHWNCSCQEAEEIVSENFQAIIR